MRSTTYFEPTIVIAWSAALYFFGPRISKASGKSPMFGSVTQAAAWARKILGRKDS